MERPGKNLDVENDFYDKAGYEYEFLSFGRNFRVKTHFGTLWPVTITSTFDLKLDKSLGDTIISVNGNLIPTEFDK